MANDMPIDGVPRYEYYTWAQMLFTRTGGIDPEDLVLILREARSVLSDAEYVTLQRDIKFIVLGERL